MTTKEEGTETPKQDIKPFLQKSVLYRIRLQKLELFSNSNSNTNSKTIPYFNTSRSIKKLKKNQVKNNNFNTIFSYTDKKKKLRINENHKHDIKNDSINKLSKNRYLNYNNPIFNNNLKKYTNNSVNFKNFNELNKLYHPYFIDKTKKLLLFSLKKERKQLFESPSHLPRILSSRNEFLKKESETYQKENMQLLLGIKHLKPVILDFNKIKDLEIKDSVDFDYFKNDKYKRIIKKALLHDINFDTVHSNYLFLDYMKSEPHKINYFEDINIIPHMQNNLSLHNKRFKDIKLLNKTLVNRNYMTKKIALSLNRCFIIKSLLKKMKEIEEERIRKEDEYRLKTRWNSDEVYKEIKLSDYEKKFEQFELHDYFGKSMNYPLVSLVDKKIKENFFQKKF
jgi:hypothetical protein